MKRKNRCGCGREKWWDSRTCFQCRKKIQAGGDPPRCLYVKDRIYPIADQSDEGRYS